MTPQWATHNGRYVLNPDGQPVPEPDLLKWAAWIEKGSNRIVQQTHFGQVKISTVFLALDHNFGWKGPPVLWETMIFGGPMDMYQQRYSSLRDAVLGHERACITALMAGPIVPERCLPEMAAV